MAGQKRNLTEQKFLWPVIVSGHLPKIILSPKTYSNLGIFKIQFLSIIAMKFHNIQLENCKSYCLSLPFGQKHANQKWPNETKQSHIILKTDSCWHQIHFYKVRKKRRRKKNLRLIVRVEEFIYYRSEKATKYSWVQSSLVLRTPSSYEHPANTDSSKIPVGENYRHLTETTSRCYGGLSL